MVSGWRRAVGIWLFGAFAALGGVQPAAAKFASIVIDAQSGTVLEAYNADARNYPASLTKMMTLYLTFEALEAGRLTVAQRLITSAHASVQAPTRLGLEPGESITVEQAILALTVKSANDAAVVLAEALGGTESRFAQLMTLKARELGMGATTFRNASGLPNLGQVTTARDMVTLGHALIRDFPQYYHYFSAREFVFRGTVIPTHNHVLVNYDGADGLKTGYIHASGFNLVTSAVRNGRRLIGVVLGGKTIAQRDHAMISLLDTGFARQIPVRVRDTRYAISDTVPTSSVLRTVANPEGTDEQTQPAQALPTPTLATASIAAQDDTSADEVQDTGWGIQVGAYGRLSLARNAARRALHRIRILHKAIISVSHVRVARGVAYRARLMGLSESQAQKACAYLHRHKSPCLLVAPDKDRAVAKLVR